jgi:2C-methyl-D-erythritol 2,4-cyclodiphosphate synthase
MDSFKSELLSDFFGKLDTLNDDVDGGVCSQSWKGEPLRSGFTYTLTTKDDNTLGHDLLKLNKAKTLGIVTVEDSSPESWAEDAYAANDVDVILTLIDAAVLSDFKRIVINPGFAINSSKGKNLLSHAVESIKRHVYQYRRKDLVVILVDTDMHEGKSDARRTLHQMTYGVLA